MPSIFPSAAISACAPTTAEKLRGFAKYAAILAVSLAVLLVIPSVALVIFVLTSAVHFGLADARDLDRRSRVSAMAGITFTAALSRGGLILAMPFAAAPAKSMDVFHSIISITGHSLPAVEAATLERVATPIAFVCLLMQMGVCLVRWRRNDVRVACLEAFETGVLCLCFLLLDPLFAIGLYVLCWHSWRHLYSLSRFLPSAKSDGSWDDLTRAVCRLHIESLPLLIPTVVTYGVLAWWRLDVWSSEQLAALTIALFVVVTLPHHLLVERLFRYGHRLPAGASADQKLVAAGGVSLPVQSVGRDLPSRSSY